MFYFILTVHLLLCVVLVVLVLLQQGKGADVGVAFGGGSNTLFGASGATGLMIKITTGIAVAFMITSILLIRAFSSRAEAAVTSGVLSDTMTESASTDAAQVPGAPEAVQPSQAAGETSAQKKSSEEKAQ